MLEMSQGIYDKEGNVEALEGIIIDITESKQRFKRIQYMSDHDMLTNLYNRRYYEEALKELDKSENPPLSIIFADINGIRLINDAFGYETGDWIITNTGKIIQGCCRKEDIVARIGGDDFAVLMPKAGMDESQDMLNKIKNACEDFNASIKDKAQTISLSMGFGVKTSIETNITEAEKEADNFLAMRKLLDQKSHHNAVLSSIMVTMYERSFETEEHARRIADLCEKIGEKFQLPQSKLDELHLFAMLHDIGKIGVDDKILKKPGKLTKDEWPEMQKHSNIGYRIAIAAQEFSVVAYYILTHHEQWNGSGYPRGLKGEQIPLPSRILAVADAYDAMTENRVYRTAMTPEKAIEEIKKNSGTQFDPEVVKAFLEVI